MKPIAPTDARWIHTLWIGLLMAVSAGLTTGYTCVVPFAALGVAADNVIRLLLCLLDWMQEEFVCDPCQVFQ